MKKDDHVIHLPTGQNVGAKTLQQRIEELTETTRLAGELSYRMSVRKFGTPMVLAYDFALPKFIADLNSLGYAVSTVAEDLQLIHPPRDRG